LAFGAMMIGACGTDAFFAGSKPFEMNPGWQAEEVAVFEWQVVDTLARYDFFVDLRHDQQYPFSNIYLYVDFTFPNGRMLRDTLSCQLADKRGNWLGSGFGNMVDHRIGFRRAMGFPLTGDYAISIAHGMRIDPLPGISDVGFRLEPSVDQ
jgi:gliding motility-associated lipoprotein GldH